MLLPATMIMLAIILTGIALFGRCRRCRNLRVIAATHCRPHCAANSTAYHRPILSADLISHSRASTPSDCATQYRPQIAIVSCTASQQ